MFQYVPSKNPGFKEDPTRKSPDHPIFKKHSITFHLLEKTFSHLEEGKH